MRHFKRVPLISHAREPLYQLEERIDWAHVIYILKPYFRDNTKIPKAGLRLFSALLILKKLYNLTDEQAVDQWRVDPFFQYFSGVRDVRWRVPVDVKVFDLFQKKLGTSGYRQLLNEIPKDPLRGTYKKIPKQKHLTALGSALPIKKIGEISSNEYRAIKNHYLKILFIGPSPEVVYGKLAQSHSWYKLKTMKHIVSPIKRSSLLPQLKVWAHAMRSMSAPYGCADRVITISQKASIQGLLSYLNKLPN